MYIEKASPWENGHAESFPSRLRDELLNRELFLSLVEARYIIRLWKEECNRTRPYSSLGYVPPAVFAGRCALSGSATLRPPGHSVGASCGSFEKR